MDTSWLFQKRTWQLIAEWRQKPPGSGGNMVRSSFANASGRSKNDQSEMVSKRSETKMGQDGGFLVDRVQVARASRQRERQGDKRSANGQDDEDEKDAVRHEAHGLWRLQAHG
jgi:hypothetical protein